jgi:S-methylmethionine-dependent homocysteine/selenocysteine methylase
MQPNITPPKTAFIQRLRNPKPLLLDGGLSNQLESQGLDLNNPLWSALLLKDNPKAIVQAHRFYLYAGADCLITASQSGRNRRQLHVASVYQRTDSTD